MPKFLTLVDGWIVSLPIRRLTAGIWRLKWGDVATKHSVLSLFNFNKLHVIHVLISSIQDVIDDKAASIDDGSDWFKTCVDLYIVRIHVVRKAVVLNYSTYWNCVDSKGSRAYYGSLR